MKTLSYRPSVLCHLVFRGVELKDCRTLDLKFILCRRFERDSGLRARRLKEKRRAISGDRKFHGSFGTRINSDVFVQHFRADGERFEGGNL